MTNTNLPDHWTPAELVGAPAHLHRAAKDYAEAYALAALAQSGQGEAVALLEINEASDGLPGHEYTLSMEPGGLSLPHGTYQLYTRPQPAQPPEAQPAQAAVTELEVSLAEALQELADCGAEAWGEDRPCVKDARAALAAYEAKKAGA